MVYARKSSLQHKECVSIHDNLQSSKLFPLFLYILIIYIALGYDNWEQIFGYATYITASCEPGKHCL